MKKLFAAQNGSHHVVVLMVVLVICAIGAGGMRVYQTQQTQKTRQPTDSSRDASLQEVVDGTKATLLKEFDYLQSSADSDQGLNFAHGVSYDVPGYDYKVTATPKSTYFNLELKKSAMTQYDPMNVEEQDKAFEADKDKISPTIGRTKQLLRAAGFTDGRSNKALSETGSFFERSGAVCYLDQITALILSCVTPQELVAEAEKVKPYVAAYKKGAPDTEVNDSLAYSLLETGTGSKPTHKYAVVSTGITGAFLYNKGAGWVYFASAQEGINCEGDVANNPDAAIAFASTCRKPGEGL